MMNDYQDTHLLLIVVFFFFFFFNNTATTEIYTLSLHDALPISLYRIADVVMGVMANIFYLEKGFNINEIATYSKFFGVFATIAGGFLGGFFCLKFGTMRSEEHTSELQSRSDLVCRLLLEKKNTSQSAT